MLIRQIAVPKVVMVMLLRVDELNTLRGDLERYKDNVGKLSEIMYDWLLLAYADGKTDVEEQLGRSSQVSVERIENVINQVIGGKNVYERIAEDMIEDLQDLQMLYENERRRVYNAACYDTAKELQAQHKTWHCLMLPTSRDTHIYLDGVTKELDEEFYTYNGNSALYPKAFGEADEDINCLCYLTFSYDIAANAVNISSGKEAAI